MANLAPELATCGNSQSLTYTVMHLKAICKGIGLIVVVFLKVTMEISDKTQGKPLTTTGKLVLKG